MTTNPAGAPSEVQAAAVSLANGLVVLEPDQTDGTASAQTLITVGRHWQQGEAALQRAIDRQDRPLLRPQLYRFYRTGSDALVFVCGIDADRDARCHVLVSDPDHVFGFSAQGNAYWVYANGMASKKPSINALSGDWLMEALPWRVPMLDVERAEKATQDSYGRWLLPDAHRPQPRLISAGLWTTHNASIVAVSRRPNRQWGATVARGGHGLPDLVGTGPGSNYVLAESGGVVWKVKGNSPDELRVLAQISGMALLEPLEILDPDGNRLGFLTDLERNGPARAATAR